MVTMMLVMAMRSSLLPMDHASVEPWFPILTKEYHLFGSACTMATMAAMAKMAAGTLPAIVVPTPTDLTILLSNALTPALNGSKRVLRFKNKKEYRVGAMLVRERSCIW